MLYYIQHKTKLNRKGCKNVSGTIKLYGLIDNITYMSFGNIFIVNDEENNLYSICYMYFFI